MKLSIVIICWNDRKVIDDCLASIFRETRETPFEVIISDNGSTDGSIPFIEQNYSQARIVRNGGNLGFARGNNAGMASATGEYVLILNPDTIIHDGALDGWVRWADTHPEAGAFGCRVLNRDGTFQICARPFPTNRRYLIGALMLRWLGHLTDAFLAEKYVGWNGSVEREVDWQSGCCVMVRGELLRRLVGFDEQFFYHFEEVDLCHRVWSSGSRIRFFPGAVITHLGGQSVGRFPIRFELEKYRNRYRYFRKHFGLEETKRCRRISLLGLRLREAGYILRRLFDRGDAIKNRLEMYRVLIRWNRMLDVERFLESGQEPDVGYEPLTPAPGRAASVAA
jgi:GT2 family glycosyltransferase